MQRSSRNWLAFFMLSLALSLGAIGCADEGVGDPCIPEAIPCDALGNACGYKASEAYVELTSVQCRSRLCIVYKLDNGTNSMIASDPRVLCTGKDNKDGCLTDQQLLKSVYCTCRCKGGKRPEDNCSCPDGFTCEPIFNNQGGEGVEGSYCIRKGSQGE